MALTSGHTTKRGVFHSKSIRTPYEKSRKKLSKSPAKAKTPIHNFQNEIKSSDKSFESKSLLKSEMNRVKFPVSSLHGPKNTYQCGKLTTGVAPGEIDSLRKVKNYFFRDFWHLWYPEHLS